MQNKLQAETEDVIEIDKFIAMADEWWDPAGKFKPLHMMNTTRINYIIEQITEHFSLDSNTDTPLRGLRILDIGCGGGLLSEPMAKLGAQVVGADAALANINIAKVHAQKMGINIDYRHITTDKLVLEGATFDVILNMEVLEHVSKPQVFINDCSNLLDSNGLILSSTINRNVKSYLLAIVGAERIMRWLPVGTHNWSKFITPDEMLNMITSSGLSAKQTRGFIFNLFTWRWSISKRNVSVNYVVTAMKA